jgi:outer membrane protein assembly factor BamE
MNKQKWMVLWVMLIALTLGTGCVYRANIAQGNLVKEEDVAQLEVGMTRNQVRFLLGTPRFTVSVGTTSTT